MINFNNRERMITIIIIVYLIYIFHVYYNLYKERASSAFYIHLGVTQFIKGNSIFQLVLIELNREELYQSLLIRVSH